MAVFSFHKRLNSTLSVDTLSQRIAENAKHLRAQNVIAYKGSTEVQAIKNAGFGLNLKQGVVGLPLAFAEGGLKQTEGGTQIDVRFSPSQALSQWGALPLLGILVWLNIAIFNRGKDTTFLEAATIPGIVMLIAVVVGFVLFRIESSQLHTTVKQLMAEPGNAPAAIESAQTESFDNEVVGGDDDAPAPDDDPDAEFDPTAAFR